MVPTPTFFHPLFHLILVSPLLPCHTSSAWSTLCSLFSLNSMSKPLLAFSRACNSRHSWDSTRTRGKRQTELLLLLLSGPQSVPYSKESDDNLTSLIAVFVSQHARSLRLAAGCVSSQTGNSSCDLGRTKL